MRNNLLIAMLFVVIMTVSIFAQNSNNSGSIKDENAIRSAVYGFTIATLTGDVKSYRQQAARRTINFYKLIYKELSKNDEMKETFRRNGIKNFEDFIASDLRRSAGRISGLQEAQIEELARRESSAPITFISNNRIKIRGVDVLLEDNKWKVDSTEAIKAGVLQAPNINLSAESRAKISRF